MVDISEDWNINYLTKQIYHDQWLDEITGSDSSVAEQRSITTVAASSLNSTGTASHFHLYSATDATRYYVWYNITDAGTETEPTVTGATGIEVQVLAADTADNVASKTVTAINNHASASIDFTAAGATSPFTLNNDASGSTTDAYDDVTAATGFTISTTQQGVGKTVYSVNSLYSWLQDTFDELGQMDDEVPMSAQTPTEYSIINNWFIDEVSIKYLNGGAIKTIGWASYQIVQQNLPSAYTNVISTDLGKVVTETDTGDTGTLLFADNTRQRWWIRPDDPATDLFDDAGSAYTIGSGTGAGTSTSASSTGENTWANMYTIGTIEANTAIYVVQDGAKITAWWPVDQIDVLIRVREAGSTTGTNGGDLGEIFIGARQYSKLYDHFVSTGITGGRNPVPLATGADLNNTTGQYRATLSPANVTFAVGDRFIVSGDETTEGTITAFTGSPATQIDYYLSGTNLNAFVNTDVIHKVNEAGTTSTISGAPTSLVPSYSDITFTWDTDNTMTFDLNNGAGSVAYDVSINLNGRTVAQMYEYLKYITGRGYTNSPTQLYYDAADDTFVNDAIDGEQYISLRPQTYTPVKASPFGTFAGGKFFGAQGVWITNYATSDAQNFQLIDSTGSTQVPPNTVSVTVSSVVAGDVVGVFVLDTATSLVDKDTYTATVQSADVGTVTVQEVINSETPQSGVLRIVDDSDPAKAEYQYEYKSWSGTVFTLNTLYSAGTPGTATGSTGSTTVLIDTDGTSFYTARIRAGDQVTNSTDSGTANVVTIDTDTQLTTTALSVGAYDNNDNYYIETLTDIALTTSDTVYVPIINEIARTTSVSNTLIKDTSKDPIAVVVRVRQGKVILPFEIENTITSTGMSQAAIRTPDTIAT